MNMLRRLGGQSDASPFDFAQGDKSQGDASDKRFAEPEWRNNPILAGLVEDYRARTQAALQLVDSTRLPDATRRKARFAMQLMCDAFAPSNMPWLNPGVVKEATESGGMSLVRGLQNFLDDVREQRRISAAGRPVRLRAWRQHRRDAGKVVFRNALIELIAYEPQTPQVHATPLLCSPPWINKYYIMDLAPGRSFVEWAVQHGHQTFMISYRNPDVSMSHYTMDDYLREGVLAALDVVQEITGAPRVNRRGALPGRDAGADRDGVSGRARPGRSDRVGDA